MFDSSIINAFLPLLLLVAVLGGVLYFLKRMSNKGKKNLNGLGVEVLSRITLQPKTHLYIIEAAGKTLLVGVTDHNISTLAELADEADARQTLSFANKSIDSAKKKKEKPIEKILATGQNPLSFANFLRSTMTQKKLPNDN